MWLGQLFLLIVPYFLLRLGSYSAKEIGDRGPIFLDDYISKGGPLGPWERYSWIVEDLHFKGGREDFKMPSFLKLIL